MSDTQDTLIERVARAWASIDGKADIFDQEKEADGYGTGVYMGYVAEADELLKRSGLATALADRDAKIAELEREIGAQVAELTQKLERATALVAKFVRCNDEGPGLIDCIDNDGERYTSQFLSDTVREARALNSGASPNG